MSAKDRESSAEMCQGYTSEPVAVEAPVMCFSVALHAELNQILLDVGTTGASRFDMVRTVLAKSATNFALALADAFVDFLVDDSPCCKFLHRNHSFLCIYINYTASTLFCVTGSGEIARTISIVKSFALTIPL